MGGIRKTGADRGAVSAGGEARRRGAPPSWSRTSLRPVKAAAPIPAMPAVGPRHGRAHCRSRMCSRTDTRAAADRDSASTGRRRGRWSATAAPAPVTQPGPHADPPPLSGSAPAAATRARRAAAAGRFVFASGRSFWPGWSTGSADHGWRMAGTPSDIDVVRAPCCIHKPGFSRIRRVRAIHTTSRVIRSPRSSCRHVTRQTCATSAGVNTLAQRPCATARPCASTSASSA